MSAYNPPLFNNSVIQFNPTIYETGTISTASQSLTLLKTDNIQCLLPNDSVTLYTVSSGAVTLGTSSSSVSVNGLLNSGSANITSLLTSDIDKQVGQTDINIGNSASNVVIKSTNAIVNNKLKTNNIQGKTAGDLATLYTIGSGAVTLGTSSSSVSVNGLLNSGVGNITSILTHDIDIQVGQTDINIGATASTLNVGSAGTNTIINGAVTLGTSGSSVILNGNMKTNNIQCKTAGDPVSLYTVASGQVTLGTGGQGVQVVGLLSANSADITGIATNNIDVQTGQTSIAIGTSATTVLIRPTNTQISGNLQANTIDKYTSNPISLYSTATGNITLGNTTAGSTTSLNSPITNITSLKTNTITQQSGTAIDIQDLRIIGAQLYPKSSQTLYLGNANSPSIEIGTSSTTLYVGSTTSTSYFKNSISAIFGVNPNTYLPAGTLTNCGMRLYNSGTQSNLDLYSAGSTISNALPSSRFISTGGTALINTAALQIQSGSIAIEPVGNLTLGSGTTTTTFVKTSDVTVIGANPTSYTLNKLTGLGLVITTAGSGINFYSNNSTVSSGYSGRIQSDSGTASSNSGTLHIDSGNIDLYAPLGNIIVGSSGTTSVTIGHSTIANVKIQTSDRVVMGNSPSTYNTTTGVLTGAACVVGTNGTGPYSAFIDLYSFAGTLQANSARFLSNSAGLTITNNVPSTPLTLTTTGKIVSSKEHNFNGGISFTKGNITAASYIQTGEYFNSGFVIGSNSFFSATQTFSPAFSSIPSVFVTNGSAQNTTCSRLVVGATNISTSQFTMTFYNNAGAGGTSGACTVRWMALGGW